MPKIAMIGAGSIVFCKTLVNDILATPALRDSEIRLMSRTKPKLGRMEAFVKRMIKENGLPATVWSTLDRREAIKGADYVIVMIQVGGVDAFEIDYEIPLKYGVDQCIGDTLGPGRRLPRPAHDPGAGRHRPRHGASCARTPSCSTTPTRWPPAAWPSGRCPNVPFIGLCHGVQTTLDLISRYVGVPKDQIDFLCAGINHMAWFLSLKDKRDGPRPVPDPAQATCEKPEYYVNEKVRVRGHAALRLLHDREHRAPVRVRAVVPQQRAGPQALLRHARLRRGLGRRRRPRRWRHGPPCHPLSRGRPPLPPARRRRRHGRRLLLVPVRIPARRLVATPPPKTAALVAPPAPPPPVPGPPAAPPRAEAPPTTPPEAAAAMVSPPAAVAKAAPEGTPPPAAVASASQQVTPPPPAAVASAAQQVMPPPPPAGLAKAGQEVAPPPVPAAVKAAQEPQPAVADLDAAAAPKAAPQAAPAAHAPASPVLADTSRDAVRVLAGTAGDEGVESRSGGQEAGKRLAPLSVDRGVRRAAGSRERPERAVPRNRSPRAGRVLHRPSRHAVRLSRTSR